MKAIAIDDEPVALDIVRNHSAKVPFLNLVNTFTDAFKALEYLHKEQIDLIFLDIKMPDISGIEFFNSLNNKPLVIFTTAYSEHAVTSFELDAVDYLLKPFSLARFLKGCNKAHELFKSRNATEMPDYIFVKTGFEQLRIRFNDILFIEASGNYVSFVLEDKRVLSRATFSETTEYLPTDRFIRVHRSFMVNMTKIDKIEKHQITIKENKVPVSEAFAVNLSLVLLNKRR
ncbi:LytR/AlgR family response regulator transcription factor [Arcticibacter sp.]|jgi:DNA-binding LytR/AlgR family response regulator|uniref:LytR/AlgR family response regulator transcription factor n=1 Tax=Arcticibacter sp. TaxID=1872630 RepID=UPI00388D87E6